MPIDDIDDIDDNDDNMCLEFEHNKIIFENNGKKYNLCPPDNFKHCSLIFPEICSIEQGTKYYVGVDSKISDDNNIKLNIKKFKNINISNFWEQSDDGDSISSTKKLFVLIAFVQLLISTKKQI